MNTTLSIYFEKNLTGSEITKFLENLFPSLVFFNWDFSGDKPEGFDSTKNTHINYTYDFNKEVFEFQYYITIWRVPEVDSQERTLYVGRQLHQFIESRVLVPYTRKENEIDPYWNIVFDNNKTYLVEDFNSHWGGFEDKNALKVDREIDLEIPNFNKTAEKVI